MSFCQELQSKISSLNHEYSKLKSLIEKYNKQGDKKIEKELQGSSDNIKQKTQELSGKFQKALDQLISEHPHSDKLGTKIQVNEGRVVCKGSLDFREEEDVYLPAVIDKIDGSLRLDDLMSAENLNLPDEIAGPLNLDGLKSEKHLELPDIVEGTIHLDNLESAQYLKPPEVIGGYLFLSSFESTEHLDLSATTDVKYKIFLDGVSDQKRDELRERHPRLADKITTY
jgi:hypothetical protein